VILSQPVANVPGSSGSGGRVLFVPVSGPRGMGEYARALAIATALAQRNPQIDIHFAMSREAPYAADTPFPKTLLPSSPTFHSAEMRTLIGNLRPTLVVFDNAGRTVQLRAATKAGARVIFVSSRPRQRRKAFRLRWMRVLDEHWIAYPEFIAGSPSLYEQLKLRWLGRPAVRYLDAILPAPDALLAAEVTAKLGVTSGNYVLVVPGGGSAHPGAEKAPQIVAEGARQIAEQGFVTVLVGVKPTQTAPRLHAAPRMPMTELAELLRGARLVVSNGGDTLLQTIACGRPCVAVPIAGDQAHRIRQCERKGFAVGARLDSNDIARRALDLLNNDARREALSARGAAGVLNGMDIAVAAIERLLLSRPAIEGF
jgi:spore coat polysaccharide biosynthesis predicted glycosyltransferase SpsG